MFGETAYPGYLGELSGAAWKAALGAGFTGSKQQWKAGGSPVPPGFTPPTVPTPVTIPTTEPPGASGGQACPPGMTYQAPPPGSGTGTCTGSIIPTGAPGTAGGISDILSSIPSIVWIGGAVLLVFVLLKK